MKILFFCDHSGDLGNATRILKNYEYIKNLHKGTVFCNLYDHLRHKVKLMINPRLLHSALKKSIKKDLACIKNEVYITLGKEVLSKLIRKEKPNVIFAEQETLAHIATLNDERIPVVADLHGIWSAEYRENPREGVSEKYWARICEIENKVYETASHIVVVSNNMKGYLLETNKVPAHRITVVQNGADLHNKCARYTDKIRCIYGGMFTFWEDLDSYLEMAKLDSVNEYFLIGMGPLHSHIVDRIEKENIEMKYLGYKRKTEALDLFAQMSIGIAPSTKNITRYVASPIKIYDYMACGLPIITPNYGEWAQHVEENGCGFVTEESNADQFLNAAYNLANREIWEEMSMNGRQAVDTKFNWNNVLAPIKDVLGRY